MYRYHAKCFLSVLFLLIIGTNVFGQTSTVSDPLAGREIDPYSRFGIGSLSNGNNTVLRGMGDVTTAYENPYIVNTDNPASYSFLQLTTYEAGAQASTRSLVTSSGFDYTTGTTTLAYIDIGIPIGKHGGMCLGLKPYTAAYYNLAGNDSAAGTTLGNAFSGQGGLNYVYVGGAYNYKGFSLGFNLGYIFGTIRSSSEVLRLDSTATYDAEFSQYTQMGGLYWKGGAMYETKLNKNLTLRLGATLEITQDLYATRSEYWIGSFNFGDTLIQDTAFTGAQTRNKIVLPTTYSLGVHLARADKWDVGVDYTSTQWSQYRGYTAADDSAIATKTYRVALGGEITPNADNIRNFWSRVTYRVGLYYGTNYVNLGTPLVNYGVTVGGSLPFKRSFSHVHASLDVGRLGTTSNGLVQETYVQFTMGMSFNDKWFVKRKYD
jgi:hypothetical protein